MDDPHPSGDKRPVHGRLQPETRRLLLDVLKQIDPADRDALWMHDAEGRSIAEIARALSIPRSAVLGRLHHGRKNFRLAVAQMRRQNIPFADQLPPTLAALRETGGDSACVPHDASEPLLWQMALSLRVLGANGPASSRDSEEPPPDSAVHRRRTAARRRPR